MSRITSVGGKVINKGGVHRVVWNRAKYGHKGPIRRSTPIDEIPFLAVARSLGDLWSYNPRNDEFVVSPEPDVSVVKIDSDTFKCLIFGTDGLWNMMSSADSVDIVRSAEMLNDANINDGNTNEWKNPSRCLVDEALDRWQSSRMRADNTSVVTIMLDRPNKKNMLKICRSPQTTLAESGFGDQNQSQSQVVEEGNHTMFDYSTSESFDLDEMPTLKRADATLEQKSNDTGFYYNNTTTEYLPSYQPPTPGATELPSTSSGYFGEPYSSMYQSTSSYCNQPTGVPRYEPSSFLHQQLCSTSPSPYLPETYSLTKLETKTERLEGHHQIYGVPYIRQPPQTTPPTMPSYSHTPLTYQQPEMNILPSLQPNLHDHHHNLQSNYNKFSMERYDYVPAEPSSSFINNQIYEEKPHTIEAESDSDDDDDEDDEEDEDEEENGEEVESCDLTISETMIDDVTESVVKVEETIADELIQINEISSSFNENEKTKTLKAQFAEISKENNNNNNNKENSVEKTLRSSVDKKSSRNVSQPTQNYRKIYVTRQMNRQRLPTSTSKNMAKEPSQRRISKRKVAKVMSEVKQPVTATVIRKMVNIVTLVTRNQQPSKSIVDVKTSVRILRNTKLSLPVVVNVTQPNKTIPEQTASKVKVLIAKTLRSSKNIMKPSAPVTEKKPLLRKSRNQENTSVAKSKLRKVK